VTDPDCLSEWLADEIELELRPGGDARFVSGDEVRTGWVEEISPPGSDGTGRLTQSGRITFDPPADWGTTAIALPDAGAWRAVLTGRALPGRECVRAGELLADFPVAVLLGG